MKTIITFFLISFSIFAQNSNLKIISTMPSLTEMAFFLDQGANVVGATPFCNYPKEAREITKIGSAVMLDYEKLIKLNANLVLLPNIQNKKSRDDLAKLNIPFVEIGHERLSDIIAGLYTLNNKLRANRIEKVVEFERFFKTKQKTSKPLRVLVVISEDVSGDRLSAVRVASLQTIYSDLLNVLGHKNVINSVLPYPVLSLEELLKLDVDIIVRVGPEDKNEIRRAWNNSPFKAKVQYVLKDYSVVTGPRLVMLYNELEGILK